MEFGERLRFLRERRELSRDKVAEKLGIGYSTLTKYENGKRQPDYETLKKMATFFRVSIDYLLGNTDSPLFSDNIKDLPDFAKKQIEDFVEFIKNKYKK